MSCIGFIKNTENQSDYKLQREDIMAFAETNALGLSCLYADTSFENIKSIVLPEHEGIVVSNIASLGTTLPTIRDSLYFCKENGLSIYSAAENYQFTPNCLTKELLNGIDLAIDIRYQMTSVITKKALAKKKETGFKLGRKGKPNCKITLQGKESELYRLLASGIPKVQIAKQLGICTATIYNFLKKQGDSNGNNHPSWW